MTEGEYILPRVQNSHDGIQDVAIIDMEINTASEKRSAAETVAAARKTFNTGKTKPYEFRLKQLKNLRRFFKENATALCDTLHCDFRKPQQECYALEIDIMIAKTDYIIKNLKHWMNPETPKKTLVNFFDDVKIYPEPLGVVLVIGAWNYPLNLTLGPALGAIAAGNCCIIKPSDVSVHTSQFFYENLPKYIDKDCYPVFLGGIPETTDLLKQRFDYIFYTGSTQVGKIIHKAAANFLTPCTLELGGKSPTYVDSSANIEMATKRILWGKFSNCGQTCVAPDYLMCTEEVQEKFLEYADKYIKEFFGTNVKQSKDLARIVNERSFIRICNLLRNQKIAIGGNVDAQELYISPTIIVNVKPDDDIMKEEIFGPVLPILCVKSPEEAVKFINSREKPLAMYIFTKNQKVKDLFLSQTSSGGVCVNDTLMQLSVECLPFGGVGHSGMGAYHGKKTFDTFVHKKSVLMRTFNPINEKIQALRYAPYSEKHTKLVRTNLKIFNRSLCLKSVLIYGAVFSLGVVVTICGLFIKKHFDEKK